MPRAIVDLVERHGHGDVVEFPLFQRDFARRLLAEADRFQAAGLNHTRPNSMNVKGAVLAEMGLRKLASRIMAEYFVPIARVFFPTWGGDVLNAHHSFIVQYGADADRSLDVHMDQSDVTVNAALGEEWTVGRRPCFTGARNSGREKTERVQLRVPVGRAIMHVGQHWHRALNIASGQRSNAIFWLRSDVRQRSAAETFVDTCEGDRGRWVRADL